MGTIQVLGQLPVYLTCGLFSAGFMKYEEQGLLALALGLTGVALAGKPIKHGFAAIGWGEPRPSARLVAQSKGNVNEQGMPSAHSMFAGFLVGFVFLSTRSKILSSPITRYGALLFAVAMAFQRIVTRKHTLFQVIVGLLLGLLFAYLYVGILNIYFFAI